MRAKGRTKQLMDESAQMLDLDVVVQQFAWKNTSLALRQVELRELFFRAIQVGLGVIDVEH